MRREWEAQRGALATVRRFNATLSAKGYVWFWPKIAAALTSKHHWLVIACDRCDTVVDLDLRVKPRDPEGQISNRLASALLCGYLPQIASTIRAVFDGRSNQSRSLALPQGTRRAESSVQLWILQTCKPQ
jgi:hypothetical protein